MKFTLTTPLGGALSAFVASIVLLEGSGLADAAEPPPSVPIHVDTNDENLEILDRTNLTTMMAVPLGRYGTALQRQHVFALVCSKSPCDATIAQGAHVLAAARPGGNIVADDAAIVIDGASKVHAEFVDRSALRFSGFVVLGGSLAASIALLVAARNGGGPTCNGDACTEKPDLVLVGASMGVLVVGMIGSFVLFFQRDSVSFSVTPLTLGAPREAGHTASASLLPNGLGVTMRF